MRADRPYMPNAWICTVNATVDVHKLHAPAAIHGHRKVSLVQHISWASIIHQRQLYSLMAIFLAKSFWLNHRAMGNQQEEKRQPPEGLQQNRILHKGKVNVEVEGALDRTFKATMEKKVQSCAKNFLPEPLF